MKTWHKVGLSLVTMGVTATAIYYGIQAFKKKRDKQKAAAEEAAKKAEVKAPSAEVAKDTIDQKTETKQP